MSASDLEMAQEVLDVYPGQTIGRVIFDFQLTLECQDHDQVALITDFSIFDPELGPVTVDPERPAEVARPLVELLHRNISVLTIAANSTLVMEFDSSFRIECPPNPKYEAWWVVRRDRAMVICMPGGELAIWGPSSES